MQMFQVEGRLANDELVSKLCQYVPDVQDAVKDMLGKGAVSIVIWRVEK